MRASTYPGSTTIGAGEDDLGGPLYLDPSAPTRAPVSAHDVLGPPLDAPGKKVLEGDPAYRIFEERWIEKVLFGSDPDQGRWSKRISLHPVYKQDEEAEVVGAGEVFVGPVPPAVYAVERCPEAKHLANRGPALPWRSRG